MSKLPILIAGGGIAGLATAIGLAQRHHDVIVFERSRFDNEAGAGIQLGPNAVHALRQLGIFDSVRAVAHSPPEIHFRDGHSGKILQRMKLGAEFTQRFDAPYLVALRTDLHNALLSVAASMPNIELCAHCDVTDIEEIEDRVQVNGAMAGRALLAADGVHSRLRQHMFPGTKTIGLRYTIFRNLEPSPTVSGIAMDCVNLWFCEAGHVVHYPAGPDRKLNLVAIADGNTSYPYKAFPFICEPLANILGIRKDFTTWPALAAPAMEAWHKGNICLIGDAAHGTLPFLAQGAAMALEDAAEMKRCFTPKARLEETFAAFQEARAKRTARLDRQSRRMAKIYHASGATAFGRNLVMQSDLISATRAIDWIYSFRGLQ